MSEHINKNFALLGAAGYIAPRHMEAIKATGNKLVAAMDKNDSVGIIDRYFPAADFFTEFERLDRHLDKLKRTSSKLDYLSICTPNYLHDAHIRYGLRYGVDVICEKPLILNTRNIDGLVEVEKETGKKINTILQLRLHPAIIALKKAVTGNGTKDGKYDIDLSYIAARGNWYYASWKGDISKSGGITTNIGVHFFDMLIWIFGSVERNVVHLHTHDRAAGFLELDNARVRWFLSIARDTLPTHINPDQSSYRQLTIDGKDVDFSHGFENLHIDSYKAILDNKGYGLEDNRITIQTIELIRNTVPIGLREDYHPMATQTTSTHPFYKTK